MGEQLRDFLVATTDATTKLGDTQSEQNADYLNKM